MSIRKLRFKSKQLSYRKTNTPLMDEKDVAKMEAAIKAETVKNHSAQVYTDQELSDTKKYRLD